MKPLDMRNDRPDGTSPGRRDFLRLLATAPALGAPRLLHAASDEYFVYFGTYTREKSKGIYVSRFSAASGKLSAPELAAEVANPSFLALHPDRKHLYSVGELDKFRESSGGALNAFAIDPRSGRLTLLNQVSSRGGGPCHVSIDKTGKNLLAANYGGGSTVVAPIKPDGSLAEASGFVQHEGSSVNPRRQAGPHAHSVNLSPDNRFAIVADLGLDQVLVYRLDAAKGTLTPNDPPYAKVKPGAGPRHFTFHPNGRFAYVINEIHATVTAFSWDAQKGVLRELQTIPTVPEGFSGNNSTAEVLVHPSGRALYGSNRGHDSIAVFSIDPGKGTLTSLEHVPTRGRTPRNFNFDPEGRFLFAANQGTDNVAVFRIDPASGRLTPSGETLALGSPVCVKFYAVS